MTIFSITSSFKLQRFTIPTRNAYHHSHTSYNLQEIIILLLANQPPNGAFERTVYYSKLLPYQFFCLSLCKENRSVEFGIAKHTKFNHLAYKNLTNNVRTWMAKRTNRYGTFLEQLEHLLQVSLLPNKQQIMYSWKQYLFSCSLSFDLTARSVIGIKCVIPFPVKKRLTFCSLQLKVRRTYHDCFDDPSTCSPIELYSILITLLLYGANMFFPFLHKVYFMQAN